MDTRGISETRRIIGLASIAAVFIGALGVTAILAGTSSFELAAGAPLPTATPTVSGETLCGKLSYTMPNPPPTIAQIQQQRYHSCLDAYNTRLTPRPMPALQMTLEARTIVAPTEALPRTMVGVGAILYDTESPLGPLFVVENAWTSEAEGKRYEVYAGARREEGPPQPRDSLHGFVSVWVWDMATGDVLNQGAYLELPTAHGPLKIVGAQAQQLALQTDDGATYYFDVPKGSFVAAFDTPAPPPPTK